jgi:hypothetical protein
VALTTDLPQEKLERGQVGAVVEILSDDAYEVEFVDTKGVTYALLPFRAEHLMRLHFEPRYPQANDR